jgi:hypothetical protein
MNQPFYQFVTYDQELTFFSTDKERGAREALRFS